MHSLFAGRRGRVAAGLLVAEFATATQALIVATIMPRVVADLHGLAVYGFAFGAFMAANFVSLPFAGPFADRYGYRRMLALAFVLIACGLLLAALAMNMLWFTGARFIEGCGAGLDYAISLAVIAKTFPEEQRPKIFALISAMWIVPALVGPVLGAFIATALGWRYVFALFLPLIAVSAALVLPALDARPSATGSVDAFASLRLLFSRKTLELADARHASFVAFGVLHGAFFGADAYVALMLTAVRGLSLAMAGGCITLGALGWSAASGIQPPLLARFGARRLAMLGAVAGIAATLSMLAVALGAPVALAFAAWFCGGAGIGLGYPTLSLVVLAGADERTEGTISSALLLAAILGMTTGIVICGVPVTVAEHMGYPLRDALAVTFAIAAGSGFWLAAITRCLPRAL